MALLTKNYACCSRATVPRRCQTTPNEVIKLFGTGPSASLNEATAFASAYDEKSSTWCFGLATTFLASIGELSLLISRLNGKENRCQLCGAADRCRCQLEAANGCIVVTSMPFHFEKRNDTIAKIFSWCAPCWTTKLWQSYRAEKKTFFQDTLAGEKQWA